MVNSLSRRLAMLFFGGLLLIGGPVVSVLTWLHIQEGEASKSWPTTQATVTQSKVDRRVGRRTEYEVVISYVFTVNGRDYRGTRIRVTNPTYSDPQDAASESGLYAVGTQHTVHYDPADPTRCMLEPGAATGLYISCLVIGPLVFFIGAVLIIGSGVMFWFAYRR